MTISDWLDEISVKFDELSFVPTTLTDEKSEHFVEWFATEIEMIHKIEETLVNAAGKKGVTQTYIEVLQEKSSLRSLLEVSITENAELERKILELKATLSKKATVEKELKARLEKAKNALQMACEEMAILGICCQGCENEENCMIKFLDGGYKIKANECEKYWLSKAEAKLAELRGGK